MLNSVDQKVYFEGKSHSAYTIEIESSFCISIFKPVLLPLMKHAVILFLLFLCCFMHTKAQQDEKDKVIIQFTGVILTSDSLRPVPFANILIKNTYRGTTADFNGYFSIIARPGEEILFSAVGFKKVHFHIPDTITHDRYSLIQLMSNDTIMLAETVIYPWPTREKFREAFVTLKVPDDDYEIARKNLALAELKDKFRDYPMDGSMNFKNQMYQQYSKLYYQGQYPPNPLLNPFAWAQFFKAWQNGDFKRKD